MIDRERSKIMEVVSIDVELAFRVSAVIPNETRLAVEKPLSQ